MLYEAYDYDEPTQEDQLRENGWVNEDELPDLEFVKDMLISVRNAIYETGDIELLEDCLEEVLASFDLSIPKREPLLEKKAATRRTIFNEAI